MKKVLALIMALMMALACTAAMADDVTALASDVSPDALALRIINVRIIGWNEADGTMTLELLDAETFAEEDIMNLKPGDVIWVNGEEITVNKVSIDLPGVTVNMDDEESEDNGVMLFQNDDGTFSSYIMDYPITRKMGTVTVKLPETALLLDGVEPEFGDPLDVPTVHTAAEFVQMLQAALADDLLLGFDGGNVNVTFNENSEPMIIERYYTPWQ